MESVGGFGRGPKSAAVGWLACGVQTSLQPRSRRGAFSFAGLVRASIALNRDNETPTAERQAIFLGSTEPRAARPERPAVA